MLQIDTFWNKFIKEYSCYKDIYDLETLCHEQKVSKTFYNYAQKSSHFMNLVMYTPHGLVYMQPQRNLSWGLIGGKVDEGSVIEEASRIADKAIPGVKLGEYEPICFVDNQFSTKGEEPYNQKGICIIARVRNLHELKPSSVGKFIHVNSEELEYMDLFGGKKILELAQNKIGEKSRKDLQIEEIDTNEKYNVRYKIHNSIVKKYILTDKLKKKSEFLDLLGKEIEGAKSIVDVSCGDSKLLEHLYHKNKLELAVGNDLSYSQSKFNMNKGSNIIFTNHDATELPFRENAFDVAICSNTLHHMTSNQHLKGLIESISKVAKKMVFVEIEDPKQQKGFPKILNKYWYEGFLKDVGERHLSMNDFERLFSNDNFHDEIKIQNFKNVQGNYMVASVGKLNP